MTPSGPQPALDVLKADDHRSSVEDPENSEYFVQINWLETRPLVGAIKEIGLFGNQDSACKPLSPNWCHSVERLKERCPDRPNVARAGLGSLNSRARPSPTMLGLCRPTSRGIG